MEDNEINQQVAREILAGAGAERVTVADNGREALRPAAGREPFDAVLMDVQMPVMDGYTATREIRKREGQTPERRLPIIAMTAHAMAGDHERSLAAGMDDHVTKPIDPGQLFAALTKWIGPRVEAQAPSQSSSELRAPLPEAGLPETLPEFDLPEGLRRHRQPRPLPQAARQFRHSVPAGRGGHPLRAGCR